MTSAQNPILSEIRQYLAFSRPRNLLRFWQREHGRLVAPTGYGDMTADQIRARPLGRRSNRRSMWE